MDKEACGKAGTTNNITEEKKIFMQKCNIII